MINVWRIGVCLGAVKEVEGEMFVGQVMHLLSTHG